MAFNVTDLSTWTDEHKLDLIRASILEGKTIKLISLQPGIKRSADINILSSSPNFVLGGSCGFTSSGDTVLSQESITVCDLKYNESLCVETLEDYYTSKMMKAGNKGAEVLPVEQIFSEEIAEKISEFVDKLAWQGNTGSGAGELSLCDGFLKKIDDNSSTVITGSSRTDFTGSTTIIASVDAVISAFYADSDAVNDVDADDLTFWIGYDLFRTYSTALRDANLFHYDGKPTNQELIIPGTNIKMVAVRGLNGQDTGVLTRASNLYMGTDLQSDMEDFSIFYSRDNDEVRVIAKFKIGFAIAFLSRVAQVGRQFS